MLQKIAIIGAGPSGSATAIYLARKGFEVVLIDRQPANRQSLKIGESLPPDVVPLLQDLGVWESFQADGHLKCYGNKSVWGHSSMHFTDFIHHPIGHGWHIDRVLFEQMLIEQAEAEGVELWRETSVTEAHYEDSKWQLKWKNQAQEIGESEVDFVVDASGRTSWLARRQGVDRLYESEQLALVVFLESAKPLEDGSSLIETVPEGWWYSANLPGHKLVTALMCEPDKAQRKAWVEEETWRALLKAAPHTAERIAASEATFLGTPYFVSASSSILETQVGAAWMAVGDAAMAYDPIASHGILMGLVSARDGAHALEQYGQGRGDALEAYSAVLWAAFQGYVQERGRFYEAERRFAGAAFWEK